MARGGVTTPESLHKDAKALAEILDDVAKLPNADAARVAEVRADIAALAVKSRVEERALRVLHPGYAAYAQKTRRVIPFIF